MRRTLVISLALISVVAILIWCREGYRMSGLLEKEKGLSEDAFVMSGLAEAKASIRSRVSDRDISNLPDDRAIAAAAESMERSKWQEAVDPAAIRFIEEMLKLDGEARMKLFLQIKDHSGIQDEEKKELLSILLRASADSNPKMVLRLLRENPELISMGRDAANMAMRSWARTDPYAALDWIRNMADRRDLVTSQLKAALIAGVGSVDVARGFKILAELGDYNNDAVRSLAQEADTAEERTAVLTEMRKLAVTLAPSMERTRLENAMTITLLDKAVKDGFRNGSRWISEAGFPPESLGSSPSFSYRKMKNGETGDWIDWIGVQFQPETGRATISNLMTDWMKEDYESASLWLQGRDPGPTKDTAVASFLTFAAKSNPTEARRWAMSLPDGTERRKGMDLIEAIISEAKAE